MAVLSAVTTSANAKKRNVSLAGLLRRGRMYLCKASVAWGKHLSSRKRCQTYKVKSLYMLICIALGHRRTCVVELQKVSEGQMHPCLSSNGRCLSFLHFAQLFRSIPSMALQKSPWTRWRQQNPHPWELCFPCWRKSLETERLALCLMNFRTY